MFSDHGEAKAGLDASLANPPDYLVIGHVSRDKALQGDRLGGTCSYAGLTASKIGQRTAALTSYGPGVPSLSFLAGICIQNVPARACTEFENIYEAGGRRQKWLATAAALRYEHLPSGWRRARIVHLAPIAQEVSPAMCGRFKDSLVCVTVQGWLRGKDADGSVICRPHPHLAVWLPQVDLLVFSRADLYGRRSELLPLLASAMLAVETLGPEGCNLYHNGHVTHVPTKPELEVDPTGAGDIFAAAFFIRCREGAGALEAARFANACAALSVRKAGLAGVPERSAVEAYRAELYDD